MATSYVTNFKCYLLIYYYDNLKFRVFLIPFLST